MFDLEALKRQQEKQAAKKDGSSDEEAEDQNHDPQFEPVVKLNPVEMKTLEENEESLIEKRCKLYRFDTSEKPHSYKERGVGILKILKHKETKKIRILMRREQTLKICANHYMNQDMKLMENQTNNRSYIWTAYNDYADEVLKHETLACRFMNVKDATEFKQVFESCVEDLKALVAEEKAKVAESGKELAESLAKVEVEEKEKETQKSG